jgi:hypothetical protein
MLLWIMLGHRLISRRHLTPCAPKVIGLRVRGLTIQRLDALRSGASGWRIPEGFIRQERRRYPDALIVLGPWLDSSLRIH